MTRWLLRRFKLYRQLYIAAYAAQAALERASNDQADPSFWSETGFGTLALRNLKRALYRAPSPFSGDQS